MDFSELLTVSYLSPRGIGVTSLGLFSFSVSKGMSGIVVEFGNFVILLWLLL